jgi:hypothetical protein
VDEGAAARRALAHYANLRTCAGLSASPLGQDDTINQPIQDASHGEQISERSQRPRLDRLGRGLQVGPHRRHHQMAAVRQHEDQLQPTPPAHPPHQLKRAALPRMPRPHDPHRRREAIEVGSVSCLPSTNCRTA